MSSGGPIVVLVIYDWEGWSYLHRARALQRHAPPGFRVELAAQNEPGFGLDRVPADVVLMLNYFQAHRVRAELDARGDDALLVTSFNTGWPRRREYLETCRRISDAVVINNRETWERAGRLPRTHPIANGVDLDTFQVLTPPARRRPRMLWCGSVYHRRLKGFDDLVAPLSRRLESEGVDSRLMLVDSAQPDDLLSPDEMARWYNDGTVYVCASAVEGTPNPVFEAAACGCVVVSTRVGAVPELIDDGVNGLLVEPRLEALVVAVREASQRYSELAEASLATIANWGWDRRARPYFALFERLWRDRAGSAATETG